MRIAEYNDSSNIRNFVGTAVGFWQGIGTID